ncbi:MAG: hypothetical protein H6738_08780 [Alphaproteobacteria bacterium]|nr:hypothetical protein [Alphaproteobacteria bacterium]MCB9696855.1 hypothetical protein [Alphaproteobacteria bacterium]
MQLACAGADHSPAEPVYVWPWVEHPGPVPWRAHMTLADAIADAGGLVADARPPVGPWSRPAAIYVKRPMADDPDPVDLVHVCPIPSQGDLATAAAGCTFELEVGDLVGISMNGTPGYLRKAPPTGPPATRASCAPAPAPPHAR